MRARPGAPDRPSGPPVVPVAPTRTARGTPRVPPAGLGRVERGADAPRAAVLPYRAGGRRRVTAVRRPARAPFGGTTGRPGGPAGERACRGPPRTGRAGRAGDGRSGELVGPEGLVGPPTAYGGRPRAASGRVPVPGAARSDEAGSGSVGRGAPAGARPGTATGPRYPRGHRPGRRVAGRARPALAPGGVRGRRYERGAAREAAGRRAVSGPEGSPTAPPPNRRPAPAWTAPSPQRDRSRSSLSHRCGNDLETRTKITVPRTRPPGSEFPGSARTPPRRVRTHLRGRTVRGPRTGSTATAHGIVRDYARDRPGSARTPPGGGHLARRRTGGPRTDAPNASPAPGRRPRRPRTPHGPCGINHKS